MTAHAKAWALVGGTVALAAAVLAYAASGLTAAAAAPVALFVAGAILTELVQVPRDESAPDTIDGQPFSFSSGVHIGAVLVLGPWLGGLVAASGVLVVDSLRGEAPKKVAYNAGVFTLAATAGGFGFRALGGSPGSLELPHQFPAVVVLWLAYTAINTALISLVVSLADGASLRSLLVGKLRAEMPSAAAEAGLGVAIAFFALSQPWAIVALVPVVLAVYQAFARLALLRRETARALETFANVVDERDSYTYRHSARVAEYVQRLASDLGLDSAAVSRLRRAGRLHDLGKISVDASVLRKPGTLGPLDWQSMRRHPRLSARLLRRFRFAADEACAVEYHHERFDGHGYYGIDSAAIPLAAHFLIVADSFDAMTTDRPYRRGLPPEQALLEIERNAGAQFHPAVAKAFVAQQRGLDPAGALNAAELAELRAISFGRRRPDLAPLLRRATDALVIGGVVGGLAAVAAGQGAYGMLGVLPIVAGCSLRSRDRIRTRQLVDAIDEALAGELRPDLRFAALVQLLAAATPLEWAGLIAWNEQTLSGSLDLEHPHPGSGPGAAALTSWLIREHDAADLILAGGDELGARGVYAALPLRRDGVLCGFLVLAARQHLPRATELALRERCDRIAARLAAPAIAAAPEHESVVAAASR